MLAFCLGNETFFMKRYETVMNKPSDVYLHAVELFLFSEGLVATLWRNQVSGIYCIKLNLQCLFLSIVMVIGILRSKPHIIFESAVVKKKVFIALAGCIPNSN